MLLAQPTYMWGYVSVQTIVDKVQLKQDVPQIIPMELVRVTKDNLGDLGAPAQDVGLHRRARRVPEAAVTDGDAARRPLRAHHQAVSRRAARSTTSASTIAAGSCHALCGENGAGKSTLGKILAGIHAPDDGGRVLFGAAGALQRPRAGARRRRRHGPPGARVLREPVGRREPLSRRAAGAARFVSTRGDAARAPSAMLAAIGARIDVRRRVGELTTGQQQMLQIAGAVGRGARVIVFDEPTSSLSQHEAEQAVRAASAGCAQRGVTSIYVSHRMEEIFRLCDTVTVLRDGRHVAHAAGRRARPSRAGRR